MSENNSDDSIHNLDSSCPRVRLCSLSNRIWEYCHSLKLSDVPVFFLTTLNWRDVVCACFFWETVKLMWFSCLPDHQSDKAPLRLTHRTSSFLLKLRNCRIYPQHLVTFIVLPVLRTLDWFLDKFYNLDLQTFIIYRNESFSKFWDFCQPRGVQTYRPG